MSTAGSRSCNCRRYSHFNAHTYRRVCSHWTGFDYGDRDADGQHFDFDFVTRPLPRDPWDLRERRPRLSPALAITINPYTALDDITKALSWLLQRPRCYNKALLRTLLFTRTMMSVYSSFAAVILTVDGCLRLDTCPTCECTHPNMRRDLAYEDDTDNALCE